MPPMWGFLYKAFYRIFAKFSYVKIPHDAGDFSLIDRRVVGWLLQCPERDLFLRGLRAYVGFRQTGVDYFRPKRMFGESTNNLIKNLAPRGLTTVLLFSLFFGAINLFAIGLVGEYVAKIMEEVKGRPRLIRAGLIRNGEVSELLPDGSVRP